MQVKRRSVRQNKSIPPQSLSHMVWIFFKDWTKLMERHTAVTWWWKTKMDQSSWWDGIPEKTETWDLIELPEGKHAVGCKQVFKIANDSDGQANRCTASLALVAKGLSQKHKIIVLHLPRLQNKVHYELYWLW